jgi:hypothetical protein
MPFELADEYGLVLVAAKSRNLRAIGAFQSVRDADMVIGKDRIILKDQHGAEGTTLTIRQMEQVRERASEVVDL